MLSFDDEVMSAYLTPQKVAEICDKLLRSSNHEAHVVGMYLKDTVPEGYLEDAGIKLPIEIAAAAVPGRKKVLDNAIRHATKGGRTMPPKMFVDHFQNFQNWGLAVLQEYFWELRKQICGKTKTAATIGKVANSALASLGAAVANLLGITSTMGVGIAALMITTLAWIGKTVLCKMTSPEELAKYFAN